MCSSTYVPNSRAKPTCYCVIDREFVTSAKKFANFNEFSEIEKILKNSYKNSLNARVGVAFHLFASLATKPTTTTEEYDAFHGFMLIKI